MCFAAQWEVLTETNQDAQSNLRHNPLFRHDLMNVVFLVGDNDRGGKPKSAISRNSVAKSNSGLGVLQIASQSLDQGTSARSGTRYGPRDIREGSLIYSWVM